MRISRFEHLTTNTATHVELASFDELVAHLGTHRFDYPSKDSVPLISPAEYGPDGTQRLARNVERVHFAAVDLDEISSSDLERLLGDTLADARVVFYSTWSNSERPVCGRLFIELSRPVEASEWKAFFPRLKALLHDLPDAKCSDASRVYFYPSAPAGTEDDALFIEGHGNPLDVDAFLESALPAKPKKERQRGSSISRYEFGLWVRGMRARTEHAKWLKEKLALLHQGAALAEEGERDDTIFRVVNAVVREFPDASAESILALFEDSVNEMGFDLDVVENKIIRAQGAADEEEAQAEEEKALEAKRAEEEAIARLAQVGREAPYSEHELASMAIGPKEWVIQRDTVFYVWTGKTYKGPFTQAEISNVAPILLSPASTAGVECFEMTRTGPRPKTGFELTHQYGQVAYEVRLDMTAQLSTFKDHVLTEAPCPRRTELGARSSPRVATWLHLLAGDDHNHGLLLDWLAAVTLLDQPCAALYLQGCKGSGKSLLGESLARIWSHAGPTTLDDAFSDFNSEIMRCPLIFADETMPHELRNRSGQLRHFIQSRQRTLKRKYMPDSKLIGCVRLVIAANNQQLIKTNEHLTIQDIDAIVERILHIPIKGEKADECEPALYLQDLAERGEKMSLEEVAQHVLYLTETRTVDRSHRFLVAGKQSNLHRQLVTGSGLRSALCSWFLQYLSSPNKLNATKSGLVRVENGALFVNVRGVFAHWDMYPTAAPQPSVTWILDAMSGLGRPKARKLGTSYGRLWFWQVDTENLITWAETSGFADRDDVLGWLSGEQRKKEAN